MGKREEGKTRLQYVLKILIEYKRSGKTYNLATAPDGTAYGWEPVGEGWLPIYAFRGPLIGGDSGDRRLRELKDKKGKYRIPIEIKKHRWTINGEKKMTWLYRLGCPPNEIDIENICLKPKLVEPEPDPFNEDNYIRDAHENYLEQLSLTI
jgi:hypothetical protein